MITQFAITQALEALDYLTTMETPKESRPARSSPRPCSRSLSESKVEEIIACLWSLMWVILWVNHAPNWMLWTVGIKAASDHLCAFVAAIREIRSEKAKDQATSPSGSEGCQHEGGTSHE